MDTLRTQSEEKKHVRFFFPVVFIGIIELFSFYLCTCGNLSYNFKGKEPNGVVVVPLEREGKTGVAGEKSLGVE